jgi:flagellar motor switch protein FliM
VSETDQDGQPRKLPRRKRSGGKGRGGARGTAQDETRAWEATVAAALDLASRVVHDDGVAQPGVAGMIPEFPHGAQDVPAGGVSEDAARGMERMLLSGIIAHERLPMLEIVFDRLVRTMSTSLRNFTSDNVEVVFRGLASMRFGDYLETVPSPSILAVFKAEQWDNYGLVMVDAPLIYSMVDVLLGGRPTSLAMAAADRNFTTIERQLVERMIDVLLRDLSDAFAPLTDVRFRFDRLEVIGRFAAISRPSNAAAVANLRVNMDGRGGEMQVLLPYATLEPVRDLLLQQYMGETLGRDSIWETHLAEELRQTDIVLDAVLDEQVIDFASVLALRIGDTLPLNVSPGTPVQLRCGPIPIFEGRTGRRGTRLAVLIDRVLSQEAQVQP